jgi:hypothetical protein
MEPNWALAGELLLAASGLWPTDPLTRDTAEEAEKLPKAWAEEMRALLEGKPKRKPKQAPAIRYLATWKRLNIESDSEPLVAQLLDGRIAGAFKAVRDRALRYLQKELQPLVVDDLQGSRFLEPSLSQQLRGNQLVAVANNPGAVIYSLRAGVVSPDALELFHKVFPAIDDLVRRTYDRELMRQRTARASYRIPWPAEVVLRALFGVPMGTAPASPPASGGLAPEAQLPSIEIRRDRLEAQTRTDRVADLGP